jgi:guanylate kinase
MSRDGFERLRVEGGFLESFEVYGQLKGTLRAPVEQALAAGRDVLLEIDVQGAHAVRQERPDALLVFLRAPSAAVQEQRLRDRGTDDEAQIRERLAQAAREEGQVDQFDAVVVNGDLETAVAEVAAILEARRSA